MKAYILSLDRKLYATKRLVEEGRNQGMAVRVFNTIRLSTISEKGNNKIFYRNEEIKHPNIVIPRIGASITNFGGCIMFQFEMMHIPLLNSSQGMYNSRDKLRATQILSSNNLNVPKTMMLRKPSKKELEKVDPLTRRVLIKAKTEKALELLGGAPVIIKMPRGTQGVGVILCKSMNDVHAQVETFWKQGQDFMVQEFIKESSGVDIRAMVVGDEVVASMRRENKTGDFRSNTHQGGEVFPHTLSQDEKEMAIKATKVLGLNVAGVDMLISKDGLKIVEVNSTPGFQGLELATGINVAEHIMKFAKSKASKKKKISKSVVVPVLSPIKYEAKDVQVQAGA